MEILELLDELEAMGDEGTRWYCKMLPFLWGKAAIEADPFFDLVAQLRSSLPDELTTANKVARDRDKIVREAHEERAKILEAAREQAQLLISNDELVARAEERADDIIHESQIEADAVRSEAETWAKGVIERLENYITRTLGTVDKAKKAMGASPPGVRTEPHSLQEPD